MVSKWQIKPHKKEGKEELTKNTKYNAHKLNPEGHKVVRAIPAIKSKCLHTSNDFVDLSIEP